MHRPNSPATAASLAELLAEYLATDDERPMDELVARTESKLRRIAGRICGTADADDCVQGAYLALLRRRAMPEGGAVEGWLVTTTTRLAYRRRSLAARQTLFANVLGFEGDGRTERTAELAEESKALYSEIDRLSPALRDPVILYYLEGLSIEEVAQLLEIRPNAVKQRLHRARAVLRSRLSWLHHAMMLPALWWTSSMRFRVASIAVVALCTITSVLWVVADSATNERDDPRLIPPREGAPVPPSSTTETTETTDGAMAIPGSSPQSEPAAARARGVVLAPDGKPLPGATVIAARSLRKHYPIVDRRDLGRVPLDPHWWVAESDEDGRFEFDGAAADGTQLCALHPKHLPSTFATLDRLDPVTLQMRTGATIRGQTLADGQPCPGVTIAVYLPTLQAAGTRQQTTSDATGAFEIAGLVPGASYGLLAQAGDLVLGGRGEVSRVFAAGRHDVRLELTPGATVVGTVRAATGEELAEVPVSLSLGGPVPKLPPLGAMSGADGRFSLAAVPAGPFMLTAAHPDGRRVVAHATAVGGSVAEVALVLPLLPPLRGVIESHAGLPVSGAHVRCTNGSLQQFLVPTGLDGRFELSWPEERVARLQVTVPGSDASAEAVVQPGEPVTIRLPPGPELHLRVVDEEDRPEPRVSLRFLGSPGGRPLPFRASSFAETRDGELRLPFPPREAVAVELRAPDSTSVKIELPERTGEVTRLGTIRLPRGVSLRGSVVCEERPVPEAEVRLEPAGNETGSLGPRLLGMLPDAVTDDHGRFLVAHVSPGSYELRVSHHELADSVVQVEVGTTVPAPVTVELEVGASISGRVLDAAGDPIQGVVVTARPAGAAPRPRERWRATSDANGRYRITGLPAGKIDLTASDPQVMAVARAGHLMQSPRAQYYRQLDLVPGGELVCDVGGEQLVALRGRLTGWPSPETTGPQQIGLQNDLASVVAEVDPRGEFELPGVPPGNYELRIVEAGHHLTRRFEVSSDTNSHLDLLLPQGEIRGRVVGRGSTPAARVTATVITDSGSTLATMSVPCRGDGEFTLPCLPAGTIKLRAQAAGHPGMIAGPTVELDENEVSSGHEIVLPK